MSLAVLLVKSVVELCSKDIELLLVYIAPPSIAVLLVKAVVELSLKDIELAVTEHIAPPKP